MSAVEKALEALRVSEGNILSQWHCADREVFEPFGPWLATTREAIAALEGHTQDLGKIKSWLNSLSEHPDLNDVVADGGVTAAMVYQKEARGFEKLIKETTS